MSMLQVTKIIEGGVDLRTGQELPRCVVISNGIRDHEIPIGDSDLQSLLFMYSEAVSAPVEDEPGIFEEPQAAPEEAQIDPEDIRPQAIRSQGHVIRVVRADDPEPPPSTDREEASFEAGEEYDDSGTGIASL